ncbi:hypothetical protein N9N28_11175 [Rubripirellula amarantea]|nr:hypothetical protein [Rubripirellula amarantea]
MSIDDVLKSPIQSDRLSWLRCWSRLRFSIALTAVSLVGFTAGCSKDEIKQAYEDAKAKTQEVTESTVTAVEAHLPESGKVSLRSTSPIEEASQATVEIISVGDGRPSSLQLFTYNPNSERFTYPAIHLHGPTSVSDVASLTGVTVPCDMYMLTSNSGQVAMTKPGESAQVTFGVFNRDEGTISATMSQVELMTSDDQTIAISGGEILAVVKEVTQ